ncbi:hypothetical protein [Streptomyces sp. NPDC007205]|uniref:hypothetical protein n=1 Tax=Streptomyces sp. NPDC007205 TaxID=3154316 RepID=UPI0033E01B0D
MVKFGVRFEYRIEAIRDQFRSESSMPGTVNAQLAADNNFHRGKLRILANLPDQSQAIDMTVPVYRANDQGVWLDSDTFRYDELVRSARAQIHHLPVMFLEQQLKKHEVPHMSIR